MDTTKTRVLFSEHNPYQAQAIEYFFRNRDVEVCICPKDGRKVLECIETFRPHIVVLDVFMPHYDAVTVKNFCQGKDFCPLMFLAHGCFTGDKIIQNVLAAGYERYLLRPYAFEVLVDIMEKALERELKAKTDLTELETRVDEVLASMRMPNHMLGRRYLCQGIAMAMEKPAILSSMVKEFYPYLARRNNTTASRVERAIRTAIEAVWERGSLKVLNEYFSCGINDVWVKPTASEFVSIVGDRLKKQIKEEKTVI